MVIMAVDLSKVEDWEKLQILQVLRRNEQIRQRDERRIQQYAVRVQLERLNDKRSPRLESRIKTVTGHWHTELVNKRCQNIDPARTLYRTISSELTSSASRKTSESTGSPLSSRMHEDVFVESEMRPYVDEEKIDAVRSWVSSQQKYADIRMNSGSDGSNLSSELSFGEVNNHATER